MSSLYRRFNELNYLSIVETIKVLNGVYANPSRFYDTGTSKKAKRFRNRMILVSRKYNVYADRVSFLLYSYSQPIDSKLNYGQIGWYRVEEQDTAAGELFKVFSSTDNKLLPAQLYHFINYVSGYTPLSIQVLIDMLNVVAPMGGNTKKMKMVADHYLVKYGAGYSFVLHGIEKQRIIYTLDLIKLYYECTQELSSTTISTRKDYYFYEPLGVYFYFEYDVYLDDMSVNHKGWYYHGKKLQRPNA